MLDRYSFQMERFSSESKKPAHIGNTFVAVGFLKVIELICRVISGDSRNQMSRNKGESSRLLRTLFRTLKGNFFPLFQSAKTLSRVYIFVDSLLSICFLKQILKYVFFYSLLFHLFLFSKLSFSYSLQLFSTLKMVSSNGSSCSLNSGNF